MPRKQEEGELKYAVRQGKWGGGRQMGVHGTGRSVKAKSWSKRGEGNLRGKMGGLQGLEASKVFGDR